MKKQQSHGVRYPWRVWFDRAKKRPMVIQRGKDYHCQPHSMGVQIRGAAMRHGLSVSVHINEGLITIEVR